LTRKTPKEDAAVNHKDDKPKDQKPGTDENEVYPGGHPSDLIGKEPDKNTNEDRNKDRNKHRDEDRGEDRGDEFENLGGSNGTSIKSKGRTIEPIEYKEGEGPPDATTLLNQIQDANEVEVAFADEGKEVKEVPAEIIHGDDEWVASSIGLTLNTPIEIGPFDKSIRVEGYGLFLDGNLAAYQQRFEPLEIPAGRIWKLEGDIVF
jgi:hypothetical protein